MGSNNDSWKTDVNDPQYPLDENYARKLYEQMNGGGDNGDDRNSYSGYGQGNDWSQDMQSEVDKIVQWEQNGRKTANDVVPDGEKSEKRGRGKLLFFIGLLSAVLLLAAVVVGFLLFRSPEEEPEDEDEPIETSAAVLTEAPATEIAPPTEEAVSVIPQPETEAPSPAPVEEQRDVPGVWDMQDIRVTEPAVDEWLPEYSVRYVNSLSGQGIYLRFSPNDDSEQNRIGMLSDKTSVTLLAVHGDYTLVHVKPGGFGWVRSDRLAEDYKISGEEPIFVTAPRNGEWLTFTEEKTVQPVTGSYIYLRYHPYEDSERIGNINAGETVTRLAEHEEFSLVRTAGGATGWVLTDRLV